MTESENRGGGEKKYIAFTFDDGPSERTDRLLETLAENNIRAAFFLIGENVRNRPEQARRIVLAGHDAGNHSDDHARLGSGGNLEAGAVRNNLETAQKAIRDITGAVPVYFRPPYLDLSDTLLQAAAAMGMAVIGAGVSSRDWEKTITTEEIIGNVLNAAEDGGIVLLHERHEGDFDRTIRAVPVIAHALRERNFEIISLTDLAKIKGADFEAGKLYNKID